MFVVDQAASFSAVVFLDAAPKVKFGTREVQDTTPDGTPKWEVQLNAAFRDQFGRNSFEVIKVNVASPTNPGAGLSPYSPVQLVNFIIGVTPPEQVTDPRTGQSKIRGGSVWYRCDSIRPLGAVPAGRKSVEG